MANYMSQTKVGIQSGTPFDELGHLLGLAAVITRFIEMYGQGNKDAIKLIAEIIHKNAGADIDKNNSDGVSLAQQEQIKKQAKAAINQVLLPLIEIQSIQ